MRAKEKEKEREGGIESMREREKEDVASMTANCGLSER